MLDPFQVAPLQPPTSSFVDVAIHLLELRERTAALSSSGLRARIAAHLSGMNDLLGGPRGFLAVVKRNQPKPGDIRGLHTASWMWMEAPDGAFEPLGEGKDKIKASLDDPALMGLLRHTGHRCALLGVPGSERRLVAVLPLDDQTEMLVGFDRPLSSPPFSPQDRETLQFAMQRVSLFYRRVARELGAIGAERLLSPRERDVLELLLTGLSEKEIAHRLGMTDRSTHQRITTLYRNYGVRSRPELMALLLHDH
jgi:DNA-binding CsgD family transcriptional regulator